MVVLGLIGGFDVSLLSFDLVLGCGNTDLQRLWVLPVMVAMVMLWRFVVGFVMVVCSF